MSGKTILSSRSTTARFAISLLSGMAIVGPELATSLTTVDFL